MTDVELADAQAPAMKVPELPSTPWRRIMRRAVLFQFVQFCMVGALSTAVNLGMFNLFMARGLGVNWSHVLAFSLAVTNGFFINRAWTFRRSRHNKMQHQYVMFIAVNLVGLTLSWAVMRLVGYWLLRTEVAHSIALYLESRTGHLPVTDRLAYSLGELTATPLCAIWNFTANRLWTFGARK